MEQVLKGLQWKSLLLYLDDIIVYSTDFDSHLVRLRTVLERFKAANLKLKLSKCELLHREVKFLGHVVNEHGVSTDPDMVKAVAEWPTPKCQPEVRTFLGYVVCILQEVLPRLCDCGKTSEQTGVKGCN